MSELLQERIDAVGWHDQADQLDYNYVVFKWALEATRELQTLRREVTSLERVLQSRTEHLA